MRTIWLFGPSGAGKTTIGKELQRDLQSSGRDAVLIDGDILRSTICSDLGFSYRDRLQQTIRAAYMAKAVNEGRSWAVVCLITPFKEFREKAKSICGAEMVYLESSQATRINRDPKGLYAKAIAGDLTAKLTGYDGAFDQPSDDEAITLNTDNHSVQNVINGILFRVIGEDYSRGAGI